jgi:hypothetical protein
MTLRRPCEDAVLPAADAAMICQALGACADLFTWAERHCKPSFAMAAADAAEAAQLSRAPGALAGQASRYNTYRRFRSTVG